MPCPLQKQHLLPSILSLLSCNTFPLKTAKFPPLCMNCLKENLSIHFLTYLFYIINICKLLHNTCASSFVTKLWPTLCDPVVCSMPGFLSFPIAWSLVRLMSIESIGDAIQPSHSSVAPFSSCSQSFLASGSFPMSWLFQPGGHKYWSFSFSISPSNEYSRLIFFRINWFDLLAVQGTLKSLLQHHTSKASVLQQSASLMVQLSYLYMTTGRTKALTMWTFVGKMMPLLFNTLPRLS